MFLFFYALEFIIAGSLILIIFIQPNSEDGFASKTNLSNSIGRPDFLFKATYTLVGLFFLNTLVLNILYGKKYKKEISENYAYVAEKAPKKEELNQ